MLSFFSAVRRVCRDAVTFVISPARIKNLLQVPLYANAVYLMLANIANALFGFVFWILAARLYSAEDVGLASAALSSAGLLAMLCGLGLGYGILRFLPASSSPQKLLNTIFTISGLMALAAAAIFMLGLAVWSPALLFIRENQLYLAVFIIYVPASSLAVFIDQSFIAQRRTGFVLWRSIIFNLMRMVLPALLAVWFSSFGIFGSWSIATFIALAAAVLWLLPRAHPGYRPKLTFDRSVIKETVPYSFVNYLGDLFWSASGFLLPLLVVNRLGAVDNAYFALAWTMGMVITTIPSAAATSLLAEGSHDASNDGSKLRQLTWRGLRMTFLLLLPAAALVVVLADKFLLLYGVAYAQNGAVLLRWLTLASLPMAVNILYLSVKRVQRQLKPVIFMTATVALVTLALSYILLPRLGIEGVGIAWLASQGVIAIIAGWKIAHKL